MIKMEMDGMNLEGRRQSTISLFLRLIGSIASTHCSHHSSSVFPLEVA